jgi:alpha-amylase
MLDWYGAQMGQGYYIEGSPLVWTTNYWPENWGEAPTVEENGYGLDPENTFGMHYWKLDVDMDCSRTIDGWFDLKAYVSNGPGWEGNVQQSGTPYQSNNHFAQCGRLNVFQFGQDEAQIIDL